MVNLSILSSSLVVVFVSISTTFTSATSAPTHCPGYKVSDSDVTQDDVSLKATLTLAGPCNLYGPDVDKLRLLVEYQTGELSPSPSIDKCRL